MNRSRLVALSAALRLSTGHAVTQSAPAPDAQLFEGLRFRNIGPAAMGVASTTSRCSRATPSIGDVAIAPNDANVVWVGTGENNNRQSSSWGTGVFKSTDGGHSWKLTGLADTRHIARIVVDPIEHDVVYVAALGHLFGPNRERGVYKTTDGGASWTNVRGSFLRAGMRRHSCEAPCVSRAAVAGAAAFAAAQHSRS